MARTSENGDVESGSAGTTTQEKWSTRDPQGGIDPQTIKQEILIELDQPSDVSISIEGKEWPFVASDATSELLSSNDVIQGTVLFGSNISDPANKEKLEKLLDHSTSMVSKKVVTNLLHEIEKLSDIERLFLYFKLPLGRSSDVDPLRMPLNPLGSRPEIMQTVVWIQTHLEEDVCISLPKHEVYEEYVGYCTENSVKPLSTADFGKVMKQVFPNVRPRRLGTRGHSRYCYSGLRKKGELEPPVLTDLYCDAAPTTTTNRSQELEMNDGACNLVRDWAEKLLGINFNGMADLANYLIDKLYVDHRSKAVTQWNHLRCGEDNVIDIDTESSRSTNCQLHKKTNADIDDHEKDHMRELKRKLQEQHSLATRRQSLQNRHSKKTKVSTVPPSSPPPPITNTTKEREVKPTKKSNCTRSKRKHGKSSGGGGSGSGSGGGGGEETITKGRTASPGDPQLEEECASGVKLSGKVAIPRLNNRSPRPSSAILILPTQQSISPTISKPKFVPIQPKPCENGTSLPQLKEDLEGAELGGESWEGASQERYEEELANYWPADGTESSSPKPNAELSQLRVLLEQNEAKKKPMAGLLERRNVHFETPLSDQNAVSGLFNSSNGNNNGGAVPPSPNTRRRAFNFTPISPRLTPDVPASPGSTGQLRQLLSTCGGGGGGGGGTNSPFVSPRQTPVPSSLPPSQPHSRHNSGHMINTDTPTSIVTETSTVSNVSDSAFVSPLNTPLSVSRSRHNSASNMLVNRARHSSGASITVRHMPYSTSLLNHGPDGLLNVSRSRHSSAGSPGSISRSAPLSPLVQSFPQQSGDSGLGCERLRQDLRRRHVSAGVVLGLNKQSSSGLVRPQTTLNSAVPLWGSDPLAQEIEGLLDSASSNVNDSVLIRSQSVPLHQMLHQFQSQGQSQNHVLSSLSQPTTPFGSVRPFNFNASAASSPYSYTATPVPVEWNDFNSHANSVDSGVEGFAGLDPDSIQEIISEVYANNHEELAPCLDGLGAEALQPSSATDLNAFTHISFQGTGSGMTNIDSDPSLSCSDTGDGYPVSDLSDTTTLPGLIGADDLAAALVALKEAPELNRLVQDVVDGSVAVPQGM